MSRQTYYKTRSNGPFGSIIALVMFVLFFVALYYVASFVFSLLWYVAPVLIIATLVMDHKIVTDYIEWIWNKIKVNPIFGISMVALTVFCFPIVAGYLFSKLLVKRKITKMTQAFEQRKEGEFVEYEEVESEPIQPVELPKAEPPPKVKQQPGNKYDDLFE